MLPVIALVGRPNVGKSTLFNVLTGTRDAIVADIPGLTRDRQYGFGRVGPIPYVVIDTGGVGEKPTRIGAPDARADGTGGAGGRPSRVSHGRARRTPPRRSFRSARAASFGQ